VDAPLSLELVVEMASRLKPDGKAVLDVGCGAGNYALKLLGRLPGLDVTLIDLSRPMLDRALERVTPATTGKVTAIQGDVREIDLGHGRYDFILAAAVLHHLRGDDEWRQVFAEKWRSFAKT